MGTKKKNLSTIAFVIVVIILVSIIGIFKYKIDQETIQDTITRDGVTLYLVEDYVHLSEREGACQALLPECGVCMGVVENEKCYEEKLTELN